MLRTERYATGRLDRGREGDSLADLSHPSKETMSVEMAE